MGKSFSRRVSRRNRKKLDLGKNLDYKIFKLNDEKLLRGAELQKVKLSEITVRQQVRTKFNDESILELAKNIDENGLIQPLVLHRENDKFVLICGERRFRAMSTLEDMEEAPCFILEDKTQEELMAIQFSENSAREALHYIDQADSILAYQNTTGASERKIQAALGVSKSEVHRCLLLAKLPDKIKEAAKRYNIEKYVLLEWDKLADQKLKDKIEKLILTGKMLKRAELKTLAGDEPEQSQKVRQPKGSRSKEVQEAYIRRKGQRIELDLGAMDQQTQMQITEILDGLEK